MGGKWETEERQDIFSPIYALTHLHINNLLPSCLFCVHLNAPTIEPHAFFACQVTGACVWGVIPTPSLTKMRTQSRPMCIFTYYSLLVPLTTSYLPVSFSLHIRILSRSDGASFFPFLWVTISRQSPHLSRFLLSYLGGDQMKQLHSLCILFLFMANFILLLTLPLDLVYSMHFGVNNFLFLSWHCRSYPIIAKQLQTTDCKTWLMFAIVNCKL